MKTIKIHGKDYVMVNERVKAFRTEHKNGSIDTDIHTLSGNMVVTKSIVKDKDGKLLGTGIAYEVLTEKGINSTSYIENCETSSVGRALAFAGYGIDTAIASSEEVQGAIDAETQDQKGIDKFFEVEKGKLDEALKELNKCNYLEELETVWNSYPKLKNDSIFFDSKEAIKKKLVFKNKK